MLFETDAGGNPALGAVEIHDEALWLVSAEDLADVVKSADKPASKLRHADALPAIGAGRSQRFHSERHTEPAPLTLVPVRERQPAGVAEPDDVNEQ
jgi:hypothetical protein